MSENDGIYKSVENACQIIRSVKCSKEDKIDAYFTLYRYIDYLIPLLQVTFVCKVH